jgi:hypothetical protein
VADWDELKLAGVAVLPIYLWCQMQMPKRKDAAHKKMATTIYCKLCHDEENWLRQASIQYTKLRQQGLRLKHRYAVEQ